MKTRILHMLELVLAVILLAGCAQGKTEGEEKSSAYYSGEGTPVIRYKNVQGWFPHYTESNAVEKIDVILEGTVTDISYAVFDEYTGEPWEQAPDSENLVMYTIFTIQVSTCYKGERQGIAYAIVDGGTPGFQEAEQWELAQKAGILEKGIIAWDLELPQIGEPYLFLLNRDRAFEDNPYLPIINLDQFFIPANPSGESIDGGITYQGILQRLTNQGVQIPQKTPAGSTSDPDKSEQSKSTSDSRLIDSLRVGMSMKTVFESFGSFHYDFQSPLYPFRLSRQLDDDRLLTIEFKIDGCETMDGFIAMRNDVFWEEVSGAMYSEADIKAIQEWVKETAKVTSAWISVHGEKTEIILTAS